MFCKNRGTESIGRARVLPCLWHESGIKVWEFGLHVMQCRVERSKA